jgi:hypothetical protein
MSPGAIYPVSDHIGEPWECSIHGFFETNLQRNPYSLFGTGEEYNYIQCEIKNKGLKRDYDNMLKEDNTTLGIPSFKNGDGVQKLVASMPHDLGLVDWELHTIEDMKWNDNHQHPIKYWSPDIIKSIRWLTRQQAHAEHSIYAPQPGCTNDTELKQLYTEWHTVVEQWGTQVR